MEIEINDKVYKLTMYGNRCTREKAVYYLSAFLNKEGTETGQLESVRDLVRTNTLTEITVIIADIQGRDKVTINFR